MDGTPVEATEDLQKVPESSEGRYEAVHRQISVENPPTFGSHTVLP